MKKIDTPRHEFQCLLDVMKALRAPDGCPWDLEQTPKSLVPYAIEEACELAEAIENRASAPNDSHVIEELGDLLFQVVFQAEIARQENRFTINDVIKAVCDKMISRHPHVFGDEKAETSEDVLKNWQIIKAKEKKGSQPKKGFGIPVQLPALQRAHKIGEKTKNLKFDWNKTADVLEKLKEEVSELQFALDQRDPKKIEHELGDVLFSAAQMSRHAGFESEQTLRIANQRFEHRFETMRDIVKDKGLNWDTLSDSEKEIYWCEAKKRLK